MLRAADLIEKHNDEIAALETWDNGKPYEQSAQIEIPMLVRLIRYYAGTCGVEGGTNSSSLFCKTTLTLVFSYLPQVGQIRFMGSQFQLMDHIMCRHCMNQLALLVRSFHGTSLFSCLLGRLDLH